MAAQLIGHLHRVQGANEQQLALSTNLSHQLYLAAAATYCGVLATRNATATEGLLIPQRTQPLSQLHRPASSLFPFHLSQAQNEPPPLFGDDHTGGRGALYAARLVHLGKTERALLAAVRHGSHTKADGAGAAPCSRGAVGRGKQGMHGADGQGSTAEGGAHMRLSSGKFWLMVINAMHECMAVVEKDVLDTLPAMPHRIASDFEQIEAWRKRGQELFDQIYARHSKSSSKVCLSLLRICLANVWRADMYGKILSEDHLLDAVESELLLIGALHSMQVPDQLRGHVRGAQNVGASEEQVNALLELARAITAPLSGTHAEDNA
ncbi:hypothetical protein SYNPS1DRAFT_29634 [Syncephalis pseudoplumigaleata]|uniref:Carboxymuconolactone decarboxylase-like domain-containing protein n=1 Tax=Syncephalis pseudoplumigaleata TaxID=1712513 RepID=A0A4P9YX85_9FUNG|nr:hypothetical protein SYNPS1DRAFT_29634 [Syncephalis pseudoplumigaleata]|eukprot:RKP24604.1 hypothetical protein SYNPS1DRAFT_29634 [Syncephalis pseudoplumigaleata]